MKLSALVLLVCIFIMIAAGCLYYPKWKHTGTESTISWDIAGYYLYLPALFIYKDIKGCGFVDRLFNDIHQDFKLP